MTTFFDLSPAAPASPVLPPPRVFELDDEDINEFEKELERLLVEGEGKWS